MEAGGVPERLAMQILGHSQVTMTRSYTTAELDRLRAALDGVGDLLALE
jgi:integrase